MMTEAHLGRLLPACLHQAISDVLPDRLDYYEEWLSPDGLRDGSIGLAPVSAVLGFLRTEGEAYRRVSERAGTLAATWTVATLPPFQRRVGASLPLFLRARFGLRVARRIVRYVLATSSASTRVRRGTAMMRIQSSVFCKVREPQSRPLCDFYAAVAVEALRSFDVASEAKLESCRATSGNQCVVTLRIVGATRASEPGEGGVTRIIEKGAHVKGRHAQRAVPAVFVALMAGLPAGAQSGPPVAASRVLVMPFSVQAEASVPGGVAASRWLGEAAASLLGDELSALGLSPLPRDGRVAVFDQLRVPMSSELTRATMIRIGELIGASEIVFGDVRMGSSLVVRARTIQLTGGRHLPEVLETGELSGIYDLFRRIGAQVARNAGRTLGTPGARPAPLPLLTLENYIKGLMAATPAAQQRFLESAMSQSPRDGRILTALWTVYTDQDLHEKALAVASAVPADSPQYRTARFGVALSLIELKRLDGAFKELTSLHTDRRSGAVSNALGIVQLRRGAAATPAAAYYFERAANEDPGQTDYLFISATPRRWRPTRRAR